MTFTAVPALPLCRSTAAGSVPVVPSRCRAAALLYRLLGHGHLPRSFRHRDLVITEDGWDAELQVADLAQPVVLGCDPGLGRCAPLEG